MNRKAVSRNKALYVVLFLLVAAAACYLSSRLFAVSAEEEETLEERIERVTSTDTVNVEGGIDQAK